MYKILLVEDDPMISEIYQRKLLNSNFEVDLAENGEDVLKNVREKQYDLVLLDLVLPEMSGIEILERLEKEGKTGKNLRIVVFSNLNDIENQEKALRLGASGFIAKSQFNPSELVVEVRRLLLQFYEQEGNAKRREDKANGIASSAINNAQENVANTAVPQQAKGVSKRIVFIEDEKIFLELFVGKLRDEGYEVVVARTGLDGLEKIYSGQTDLVITDVMMPKMKGDEVVRRLKSNQKTSRIPIIVLSASVTDEEIKKIRQYGLHDFFVKTEITPSDLARRVRKILK